MRLRLAAAMGAALEGIEPPRIVVRLAQLDLVCPPDVGLLCQRHLGAVALRSAMLSRPSRSSSSLPAGTSGVGHPA